MIRETDIAFAFS